MKTCHIYKFVILLLCDAFIARRINNMINYFSFLPDNMPRLWSKNTRFNQVFKCPNIADDRINTLSSNDE